MTETSRRKFFVGLAALVAAPAIVRATSLMPVRALPATVDVTLPTAGLRVGDVITIVGDDRSPFCVFQISYNKIRMRQLELSAWDERLHYD